ncbi:hypothetical protein ACRALDRAFT_1082877 [Sodiomyces alcalophilus JCM 7366]|uniref:uncharacterized protein n=1 Tax=Sodiomyces alcalophilus JCM 7366 TaxID=591952 RepID=UPI0039B397A4
MAKKRKLGGASRFPDTPGQRKKHKPGNHAPPPPSKQRQQTKTTGGGGGGDDQTRGKKASRQRQFHANQAPVIPFKPDDPILLVGEGDLSFAASLAAHHGCTNLTATVLEKNETELLAKYPHAGANMAKILAPNPKRPRGDTADVADSADDPEDATDHDRPYDSDDPSTDDEANRTRQNNNKILYNVDATSLKAFTTKPPRQAASQPPRPPRRPTPIRKTGRFRHIIFNFPHVGGKSTDVNRQVRHNQSLLVAFFQRAVPSLAPGGDIIVTLFEGEPYTLWNVRDLARHAGLGVDRTFRFPWTSYPGYRHARTLGVVKSRSIREAEGGKGRRGKAGESKEEEGDESGEECDGHQNRDEPGDEEDDEEEDEGEEEESGDGLRKGESKTAWRGEDRAARSYVFRRKEEVETEGGRATGKKKKRRKGEDSDSDSD